MIDWIDDEAKPKRRTFNALSILNIIITLFNRMISIQLMLFLYRIYILLKNEERKR